ncbi:MAG: SAM-dependent methyltransferase [Burkholderiales bacterium]
MKNFICSLGVAIASVFALITSPIRAQEEPPKITEETPYVPSPRIVVDTMLRMANVHKGDFLIDLGSGDGRIIITAAQEFNARGFGVDYDPRLVKLATENAQKAGVSDRARFIDQNVFKTDLAQASVVTIYLLPEYNAVLKPTLLALKPGTRIVSHDYGIADWEPDAQSKVVVPEKPVGVDKASWIYYWMVPAKVEGQWRSRIPFAGGDTSLELNLKQQYQKVEGTVKLGSRTLAIERPMLKGDLLSFELTEGRQHFYFEGRIADKKISGTLHSGGKKLPWNAAKIDAPKV